MAEPGAEGTLDLGARTLQAGRWSMGIRVFDRALGLVRTIVLARLLAPEDFGVFGLTLLALSALETFSHTGLEQALIQNREEPEAYLDTVWTVQALRGLVLALIIVLAAPALAGFFEEPGATGIFRVVAVTALLNGIANPGVIQFQRHLDFRRQFVFLSGGTVAELVVAVVAAFVIGNAWALVLGLLARATVRTAVSYGVHPYRPRPGFDRRRFSELFGFGRMIFLQGILLFLLTQGDDVFVGKLLGAYALGLYQIAYRFSNLAATEVAHVVSGVMFPALSRIQNDPERMARGLERSLGMTAFLSLPLAATLFVLAPELTLAFLGASWLPMVPAFRLLCLFGALRSVGAALGPAYMATDRMGAHVIFGVVQLAVVVSTIYPLTVEGGIAGTALSVTLGLAVAVTLSVVGVGRILPLGGRRLAAPLAHATAVAGLLMAAVGLVRRLLGTRGMEGGWLQTVLLGTVAMTAWCAGAWIIRRLGSTVPEELLGALRGRPAEAA